MSFIGSIDWYFRHKCQALLNFLGRKFGVTRKLAIINSFILFLISFSWTNRHDHFLGLLFTVVVIAINFGIIAIFLYFCDQKDGEARNWEFGKVYRWTWLFLGLVFSPVIILSHSLKVDDFISDLTLVAQGFMIYFPTCIEAPPREKKERRVLAPSLR